LDQYNKLRYEKPPLPLTDFKKSRDSNINILKSNDSNIFKKQGEDMLKQQVRYVQGGPGNGVKLGPGYMGNGGSPTPNIHRPDSGLSGGSGGPQGRKQLYSPKGLVTNIKESQKHMNAQNDNNFGELYNKYMGINREPSELSKINDRLSQHLYNLRSKNRMSLEDGPRGKPKPQSAGANPRSRGNYQNPTRPSWWG
jgi:hypothetical protein